MNIFNKLIQHTSPDLFTLVLYDETTFYNEFTKDLLNAENEVIIESLFISTQRMKQLRYLNVIDGM